MSISANDKINLLDQELEQLQKQLEKELRSEALGFVLNNGDITNTKGKINKKIFRASRITAYKIQIISQKMQKLKSLKTRFSSAIAEEIGDIAYDKLLTLDSETKAKREREIKQQLLKNLHTNIVERVIAGDVAKAQELLVTKNRLERELRKKA